MTLEHAEFDDLVLHAALSAAIREVNPELVVRPGEDLEEKWVIAQEFVNAMGWWQLARPRDTAVVRVTGELTPGIERGPHGAVRRDLAHLLTPSWYAPTTPVEVRSGDRWFGAIVQGAERTADTVTVKVRIMDDATEPGWLPIAVEPTMPITRFIDIFDEVLANRTESSEVLSSPGRRQLIVMTMVKNLHRAGWVLADFPVEPLAPAAPPP